VRDVDPEKILFDAPRKDQQVWFIRRFGADVNLGNIAPVDVLSVETLRLGLRADTLPRGSGAGGAE
jgi:phosphosulfolactate synthase